MAKRNGKVRSVTSAKNYLIDVHDESIVIIIPRTKPCIPHEKKRRETAAEEIYMSRVSMANELVAYINSDSDDDSDGCEFSR
ncbi:MAG: hypothetical protein E7500_08835 [Ruminococcus sp.]|nr:hypothetical protein [Ruminococcus sp.]